MNKQNLTTFFLAISTICFSQTTETKYYNQRMDEVRKEKAKYAKTITEESDGTITTSTLDLKKNIVTSSQTLKGEEPFGVWIYQRGVGTGKLDYNFQLNYSTEVCSNNGELGKVSKFFEDYDKVGYKAPKLSTGDQNIYKFIGQGMIYPAKARRQGIQGEVVCSFIITKEGKVENIVVSKGIDVVLDKEAVRIIRALAFSTPPTLNGQPTDVCVQFPIMYKLG
jgi:TonB family protein